MKKLLLLLLCVPLIGFGQTENEPLIVVEQMPMLGDCKDAECTQTEMIKFILRNFRYPEISKANGIEGQVVIEFVVEKDGKVGRVKILKGLDKHIDKAAIEVVEKFNSKNSPKFSPGKQLGKAVPVKFRVPIKCTLDSGTIKIKPIITTIIVLGLVTMIYFLNRL